MSCGEGAGVMYTVVLLSQQLRKAPCRCSCLFSEMPVGGESQGIGKREVASRDGDECDADAQELVVREALLVFDISGEGECGSSGSARCSRNERARVRPSLSEMLKQEGASVKIQPES
jgi:hypothetical protein